MREKLAEAQMWGNPRERRTFGCGGAIPGAAPVRLMRGNLADGPRAG
ncbi:hypothetical protein [Paenibacillus typhae]|nr:hypothetical protein [Paenibacillus typhae]